MPELLAIPGFNDPVSSLSHLLGGVFFVILGTALVRRGLRAPIVPHPSSGARVASLTIFSLAAVTLLTMSGVYHLLNAGHTRNLFQRLDHAAIFILIAATFTPIHTILFRGLWRWGMLTFIWSIAIAGVLLKTLFFHATPHTFSVHLYLAMGWVGLASVIHLARRRGIAFAWPVLAGGIAYTLGAIVELGVNRPLVRGVIRAHEIFHIAVLIGLFCHWLFMWRIATCSATDEPAPEPVALPRVA